MIANCWPNHNFRTVDARSGSFFQNCAATGTVGHFGRFAGHSGARTAQRTPRAQSKSNSQFFRCALRVLCVLCVAWSLLPSRRGRRALYLFRRAARLSSRTRSARTAVAAKCSGNRLQLFDRSGFSPSDALRICLDECAARELRADGQARGVWRSVGRRSWMWRMVVIAAIGVIWLARSDRVIAAPAQPATKRATTHQSSATTAPTSAPVDQTTPKGALKLLAQALEAGDRKMLLDLLHADSARRSRRSPRRRRGWRRRRRSCGGPRSSAFGECRVAPRWASNMAAVSDAMARVDASTEKIDGDKATVTSPIDPADSMMLVRRDAKWRVPMAQISGAVNEADLDKNLTRLGRADATAEGAGRRSGGGKVQDRDRSAAGAGQADHPVRDAAGRPAATTPARGEDNEKRKTKSEKRQKGERALCRFSLFAFRFSLPYFFSSVFPGLPHAVMPLLAARW